MSMLDGMYSAGLGMVAQSERIKTISSNIANMNTISTSPDEAFKAKFVNFKTINVGNGAQSVVVSDIVHSQAPSRPIYAPSNPLSDEQGYVYGSNVNREEMVADMISAEKSFELNSRVALTLKKLSLSTLQTINR